MESSSGAVNESHEPLAKVEKVVIPAGFKPESGFLTVWKDWIPDKSIRG
jgi:hypothetical protein